MAPNEYPLPFPDAVEPSASPVSPVGLHSHGVVCFVGERRVQVARATAEACEGRVITLLDPERHHALSPATVRGVVFDARRQAATVREEATGAQWWALVVATNSPAIVNLFQPTELVSIGSDGNAARIHGGDREFVKAWDLFDGPVGEMWERDVLSLYMRTFARVFTP